MADVNINIASQFVGKKAFKQAETATNKLQKNVKSLAASLGIAFGARAIVNFAKLAIKTGLEQQAQQDRLNKLLKVGVGASSEQVAILNRQASALEKIGVVSAGNVTQTQSQLATFNLQVSTIEKLTPAILDYVTAEKGATASAADFKSMTNGLAQALNGNFASLTKVGFVIDENTRAQIKNGSEAERAAALVKVLDSTYKGFNAELRKTPTGQMQVLANTADDARTIIGQGLVQALVDATGGVDELGKSFDEVLKVATVISDLSIGIGRTFSALAQADLGTKGVSPLESLRRFKSATEEFRRQDALAAQKASISSGNYGSLTGFQRQFQDAQAKRSAAAAAKLAKAAADKLAKVEKDKLKATKDASALSKANSLFDINAAGIIAALKGDISKEERTRLELQLAILTGNTTEASKLAAELGKAQGLTKELIAFYSGLPDAKNPFSGWITTLLNAQQLAASIAAGNYNQVPLAVMTSAPSGFGVTGTQYSIPNGTEMTSAAGVNFTVNVNAGSIIAEEALADVVRDNLLNNSLQAKFAAIFRQGGSFG
jgi:hypothetical protein